jgi:hypothetical protein
MKVEFCVCLSEEIGLFRTCEIEVIEIDPEIINDRIKDWIFDFYQEYLDYELITDI